MRYLRVLGFFAVLAILLALAAFAAGSRANTVSASPGTALTRPAFLTDHALNDATAAFIGEKLDAEAGISAWVQTALPIDLNLVRGQFRTIETETADYIIGSVPVPTYVEHFDPHVYIHKNGWILAYYLKTDPAAKMIDLNAKTIDTDKLKTVVANLAALAGTSAENIAYYDFRYPNATHILLVTEDSNNGLDFNIQLPTGYSYNELSFAIYNSYRSNRNIRVDGNDIYPQYFDYDDYVGYGTLTLAQISPGTIHNVSLTGTGVGYLVLTIIHRVP